MYEKILAAKKSMEAKEAKKRKLKDPDKPRYEYDSDEDIEGGTWEHKKRKGEMEKTIGTFSYIGLQIIGPIKFIRLIFFSDTASY